VLVLRGAASRRVLADRMALIDEARPVLAGAARVATLDVGWVGAASDASIVDLAGATDPEIASLPGGHTTKAISGPFLTGRTPDRLVFQIAPRAGDLAGRPPLARGVEIALGRDPLVLRTYRVVWTSPDTLPIQYEIWSTAPYFPPTSGRPPPD
jgi:hypothetical protein